ncbi:alpha/beta hydrolase [Porticoccaceae bacterium]|nr:alpha/beta hydrolase [Porticoccaceae bacterium]MDC1513642.1 alpha/beta hydrolase [Porticoccaceae bacterium]
MSKTIDIPAALGLPPLPSTSPDAIAALMWVREVLQNHKTTSYAVTNSNGIEELKAIKIGGVDQWIHIRGQHRDNPVLLWLHGGPGAAMIGFMDEVIKPYTEYFTVVCWDQRQTGKSYYPADDETAALSVQQFIDDTEELIDYLRDYLAKDKLFLMGSSWGSILGMHMVKSRPDWLYAYIGVGQVVNSTLAEQTLYQRLLSRAKENKESELVAKIEALLPGLDKGYPEKEKIFVDNCSFVRQELNRLAGETSMHHLAVDDIMNMLGLEKTLSPHITLTDLSHLVFGGEVALFRPPYTFTKEFLDIDLPKDIGNAFEVPIFFFTGRHDWQTPIVLSDQWFEEISAPYKEVIHFEESSHCVVNEEPGKTLIALVNKVLPFAKVDSHEAEASGATLDEYATASASNA